MIADNDPNRVAVGEQPERLTYTIEEAARLLGISRGSAYEAVRRGELPVLKIGKRLLVPRAVLERILTDPQSAGNL